MTRSPQEKFVLLFETARRSLLASDLILARLTQELAALEPDIQSKVDIQGRAASPLLAAVALIDFSHRFGSVVDALPLINKKTIELRLLRETLESVETARNHLQHMRGDLSASSTVDYPILGAISWANGSSSYTICMSQPQTADMHSLVYDTHNKCWVTTLQYTVKHTAIDIPRVNSAMHRAYQSVSSSVDFLDPSQSSLSWGETLAFGFHVRL
ncbi:hypothetical protein GCM10027159_13710 [Lysobacter terrae]